MQHVLPLFVHSCADIQKTSRGQADLILNIIARFFSDFNVLRPESGGFPVGHVAQEADYVHPYGIQKQLLQKCILQFFSERQPPVNSAALIGRAFAAESYCVIVNAAVATV